MFLPHPGCGVSDQTAIWAVLQASSVAASRSRYMGIRTWRGVFAHRQVLASVLVVACGSLVLPAVSQAGSHRAGDPPTFTAYTVTDGKSPVDGGEPSIGVDPRTNAVIYGAGGHETRMVFN